MEIQKPRVLTKEFWGKHLSPALVAVALAASFAQEGTHHLDDVKTLAAQNIRGEVLEYIPYLDRGLIERQRDLEVGYQMEEIAPWIMDKFIEENVSGDDRLQELAALSELRIDNPNEYWDRIRNLPDLSVVVPLTDFGTSDYPGYYGRIDTVYTDLDLKRLHDNLGESFYMDKKYGTALTFQAYNEHISAVMHLNSPTHFYADFSVQVVDTRETRECDDCPPQTQTPEMVDVMMGEIDLIPRPYVYSLARTLEELHRQNIKPTALIMDLKPDAYDGKFAFAPNAWSNSIIIQGLTEEGTARYFASRANKSSDAYIDWIWNSKPY